MFPKVSRLTLEGWLDMCAKNVFGAAWYSGTSPYGHLTSKVALEYNRIECIVNNVHVHLK